jgi:hypothetical protein
MDAHGRRFEGALDAERPHTNPGWGALSNVPMHRNSANLAISLALVSGCSTASHEPQAVGLSGESAYPSFDPIYVQPEIETEEQTVVGRVVSFPRNVIACGCFTPRSRAWVNFVDMHQRPFSVLMQCPWLPGTDETERPPDWPGYWWGDVVELRVRRILVEGSFGSDACGGSTPGVPAFVVGGSWPVVLTEGRTIPASGQWPTGFGVP